MSNTDIDLFSPLTLGPNTLRNRIVMAPMTRNRAGAGNVPQAMNVDYYRQRAGAGLIITEASQISPDSSFNDMHDSDPQTLFNYVADVLSSKQLGYMHVLEGGIMGEQGVDYDQIRQRFAGNYMANLGYDKVKAQAAIARGHADLVSFGTLYLANPDLVERFKADAELNTADQSTFYGGDEHGYTDYPYMEN